jgi:hypothetical protein
MGVSRSGVLAGTVAAAILANSATWTAALAQQAPVNQRRDEAPIGNQQPRIQDLSPSVLQDEKKMEPELDAIGKELEKLENRICRGC